MPTLARNQSSSCANPELDLFTRVSGLLTDVTVLEFQIFDVTTGTPVQVFPLPPGTRQAVNVTVVCPNPGAGKIGTGHFFASYTVPSGEPLGKHRIKWFFKLTPTSAEATFEEDFDVVSEVLVGGGDSGYCSISDLRDEGVTTAMADDARLGRLILLASRFIDRVTGRWFEARDAVFHFDGLGSRVLFLEAPIVSISTVKVDDTLIDPTAYKVYNRHLSENLLAPDDRDNPRIEFIRRDLLSHVPSRFDASRFERGEQNVEVTGIFGYTDPDSSSDVGVTPPLIRHACKLLAMRELFKLTDPDRLSSRQQHRIASESTRDQSVSYGAAAGVTSGAGILSSRFTGDPEIDVILEGYAAPPRIAVV